MKTLLFLLLLSGCSIELKHQRELQSLSFSAAEKCRKNLKDTKVCTTSVNCLESSVDGVTCYNNYRVLLKRGLHDDAMKADCEELYKKSKEVCK
jgi:hypothetical protein